MTDTEKKPLARCPFCEKKDNTSCSSWLANDGWVGKIECVHCGIRVQKRGFESDGSQGGNASKGIKAIWNIRPIESALQETIEALKETCDIFGTEKELYKNKCQALQEKLDAAEGALLTISTLEDYMCEKCPCNDDCEQLDDIGECCRNIAKQALKRKDG